MSQKVISLGSLCQTAQQIRKNGLSDAAYPFDWIATRSLGSIAEIIERKFDGFLCRDDLEITTKYPYIINHRWQIDMPHTFADRQLSDFDDVSDNLQKRGRRLLRVLNGVDQVIFVRQDEKLEEGQIFVEFLRDLYPTLNFRLILTQNGEAVRKEFDSECLALFHLPLPKEYKLYKNWQGFDWAWGRLFFDLGLKVDVRYLLL